uniref:Uncharacterized protein n=1 Tax=Trichuris muris TaxID=70415 RepID=A0A5S6Q482_TRIMR
MVLRYMEERDDVLWQCCGKQCREKLSPKTGTLFQDRCEQPVQVKIEKYDRRQSSHCCVRAKGCMPSIDA